MTLTYQPSGNYERAGLWGIPLGTALISSLGALAYTLITVNFARDLSPPDIPLLFLALGAWFTSVIFASCLTVVIFKMRRPTLATVLTVSGVMIAWLFSWLLVKHLAAPDQTFLSFVVERLTGATRFYLDESRGPSGYQLNRPNQIANGLLLAGGWLLEILTIGFLAGLTARFQAAQPFSESEHNWLTEKHLKSEAVLPENYQHLYMVESLKEGNLWPLKDLEVPRGLRLFSPDAICIHIVGAETADSAYVTLSLRKRKNHEIIIRNLKLTAEEKAWILDKFDRATG